MKYINMINKTEKEIMSNWTSVDDKNIIVSIRCITYNHEKYISQCLNGFLMQETTFPFKIIVHDDASIDGTANIIRKYEKMFPNIIIALYEKENLYSKKDGSFSKRINSHCTGKYIALCEGDDYWVDTHKLQQQYEALEKHPECALCTCLVKCCNEDGSPNMIQFPNEYFQLNSTGVIDKREIVNLLCIGYPFHTSGYFFRKNVYFYLVPGMEDIFKRDVGEMLRAVLCGSFYYINHTMSIRRYGAVDSWNTRRKANIKKSRYLLAIDDYNMYSAFDIITVGQYRNIIFTFLCKKLIIIADYDRKQALDMENEEIKNIGVAEYNNNFNKVLQNMSLSEKFTLRTFRKLPLIFLIGKNIINIFKKIKRRLTKI